MSFSGDGTAVSYSSTFYHAAFEPGASCAGCDLDAMAITSVNRAYLAALGGSGGSEMAWLLPGVPPALGGLVRGLAGALQSFVPGMDDGAAAALADRQWWACDVWPPAPSPMGPLELCAWASAAGRPALSLGEAGAAALLATLRGDPSAADGAGSDPAARAASFFFGLSPPPLIAAATGMTIDDAATVQGYVRAAAAAWVGPSFETFFLGPPLGPASGGLLVTRPARAWIEGWADPLLAAALPGGPSNPGARVSAGLAFSSLDAPALLVGRPLTSLSFRDHPAVFAYTVTTGKPTEDVDAAAKKFVYGDTAPGRLVAVNGQPVVSAFSTVSQAFAFPGPDPTRPGSAPGGAVPLTGASLGGAVFKEKEAGRGAALRLFEGGLGRPLSAVPAPGALGRATPAPASSSSSTPPPAIVRRRGGKQVTVHGIDAVVYGLDGASTAACNASGVEAAGGAGALNPDPPASAAAAARAADPGRRCAFPDPAPWTWNASLLYGTPTLLGLPRWAGAPASVAAGGGPVLADPPPAGAGPVTPPEAAWWFSVEPFSGLTIAAHKPVQVAHRAGPTDALYPSLWSPPGGDGTGGAGPAGWVPTHWATAAFAADIPAMRSGLAVVWAMRVILSYTVPAVALAVGAWCAWCLVASPRGREAQAALKLLRACRAPPTALSKEEVTELMAAGVEGGEGA